MSDDIDTPLAAIGEKVNTTDRKHHEDSPSSLQPKEVCPGFQGTNEPNAASIRGTYLHDCVEKYISKGILDPNLDDEQVNVVLSCAQFVKDNMIEMGPDTILVMEEYLPIDEQETTAGYLDIGLVNLVTRKGRIIDWKMGENPVEPARNNVQGMSYLLGIVRMFNDLLDSIIVQFVMPFQGEGIVDTHEFHREEYPRLHLRIATIVARVKHVRELFNTGNIINVWREWLKPTDKGCLFCARKHNCPALHELVLSAGKKYDPLIVPDVINPMLIKDSKQAGAAIKFFSIMESLAKAYRAKATEKAMNDEVWLPEGYMVTTMSSRKIVDKKKFAQIIRALLTEEEYTQCIDFTLGPVEDAIKAKAPRGKKSAAVEELDILLKTEGAVLQGEPVIQLRQKRVKNEDEAPKLVT
jgi:hypothetical protein